MATYPSGQEARHVLLWSKGRLEPVSHEIQLVAEVRQFTQGEEHA